MADAELRPQRFKASWNLAPKVMQKRSVVEGSSDGGGADSRSLHSSVFNSHDSKGYRQLNEFTRVGGRVTLGHPEGEFGVRSASGHFSALRGRKLDYRRGREG